MTFSPDCRFLPTPACSALRMLPRSAVPFLVGLRMEASAAGIQPLQAIPQAKMTCFTSPTLLLLTATAGVG